jgi:hypothetical protein
VTIFCLVGNPSTRAKVNLQESTGILMVRLPTCFTFWGGVCFPRAWVHINTLHAYALCCPHFTDRIVSHPCPNASCTDVFFLAQASTFDGVGVQALMCIHMLTPTTHAHRVISTTDMHVFRSTSIRAFKGAATPTYGSQHGLLVLSMFSNFFMKKKERRHDCG